MADEQGGAAGELGEKAAEKAGGVAGRVAGGAVGSALPGVGTAAGQAAGKIVGEQAVKHRKTVFWLLMGCAALSLLPVILIIVALGAIIGPFFGGASKGGSQQAAVNTQPNEGVATNEAAGTGCKTVRDSFRNEAEALAHMARVPVRVWRLSGNTRFPTSAQITVQRCQVAEVKRAFELIFNDPEQFPTHGAAGYNYRCIKHIGFPPSCPFKISYHATGLAIDINPVQNPHIKGPNPNRGPLVITANGSAVRAFSSVRWIWGGTWNSSKDWMHFSLTGG